MVGEQFAENLDELAPFLAAERLQQLLLDGVDLPSQLGGPRLARTGHRDHVAPPVGRGSEIRSYD